MNLEGENQNNPKYYLTKEGLMRLKNEYKKLLKARELKLKQEAPPVLHSEELNTEFVSFREDVELLERKINWLEEVFKNFQLIKIPPKKERKKVHLGAKVKVESRGKEKEFLIVGKLEADPLAGKISNESPLGKALLGHKVGDKVEIKFPTKITYTIKSIKYNFKK